ncbi:hypothetical protein Vretimale_10389, partial [Volvox reticuliferus]
MSGVSRQNSMADRDPLRPVLQRNTSASSTSNCVRQDPKLDALVADAAPIDGNDGLGRGNDVQPVACPGAVDSPKLEYPAPQDFVPPSDHLPGSTSPGGKSTFPAAPAGSNSRAPSAGPSPSRPSLAATPLPASPQRSVVLVTPPQSRPGTAGAWGDGSMAPTATTGSAGGSGSPPSTAGSGPASKQSSRPPSRAYSRRGLSRSQSRASATVGASAKGAAAAASNTQVVFFDQNEEASLRREMKDRVKIAGLLSSETRYWVHVDKYGNLLEAGQKVEEGDNDIDPDSWKATIKRFRKDLWNLMTEADSSKAAYGVSILVVVTIILSTVCFCLETVPEYSKENDPDVHRAFVVVEAVTVQIFTADYLLRLISCPSLIQFLISPFNIIDLVSVVPWYVDLALADSGLKGTAVFRVLRLLRVFRVLKLGSRYKKLLLVTSTLAKSVDMLMLMVFFVSVVIVAASTLMYFAEKGSYNESNGVHPFRSIPSGFWWAIVTLMTVGYGDVLPVTVGGRFIACVTMLCGILSIALPVAVISSNFTALWEAYQLQRKRLAVGQGEASPQLAALAESLGRHLDSMKDLDNILEQNLSKMSSLQSILRERGAARETELESLLQQWADIVTPPQAAAARRLVSALSRLGADPEAEARRAAEAARLAALEESLAALQYEQHQQLVAMLLPLPETDARE